MLRIFITKMKKKIWSGVRIEVAIHFHKYIMAKVCKFDIHCKFEEKKHKLLTLGGLMIEKRYLNDENVQTAACQNRVCLVFKID